VSTHSTWTSVDFSKSVRKEMATSALHRCFKSVRASSMI
jgi:hypothetical protein